jgi:hypothetical protein
VEQPIGLILADGFVQFHCFQKILVATPPVCDAKAPAGRVEDCSRSLEKFACRPHPNLAGSLTALVDHYEN